MKNPKSRQPTASRIKPFNFLSSDKRLHDETTAQALSNNTALKVSYAPIVTKILEPAGADASDRQTYAELGLSEKENEALRTPKKQ